jgi:hypothetical protein
MLKFDASAWTWFCFDLEQLQGDALFDSDAQNAREEEARWRRNVALNLTHFGALCKNLGMDASVGQCERIAARATGAIEMLPLCYLLRDVEQTIGREIKKPLFLMLRADLAEFYDQEDKSFFGARVSRKFRKTKYDISEARRCFALERWDGCVHHLMIATEHALRVWAKMLNLTTKKHIDDEDQKNILDAAESERKRLLGTPKTEARDKQIKYLSETAGHFGFVKDAYRNYSAHGKERYDERKARNLMTHIEAFMRLLANDA